ncbi:MAG: amidohydrolase family protein [Candidatus Eisenbacteria bacterium]|uniref:Amidohydrolase family protein n=1 Tax=Eiseniibacteriota bacterium TaxID=2212470 RepID=A0A849SI90_UNCEI|nr:amidohydrolase family protein [Candidatus Eisenbacteria bacterium]
MDDAGTIAPGDVLVRDGRIAAVGRDAAAMLGGEPPDERFDATGMLVLPGLVQAHLHLCQTLFRGIAEHADLMPWLRERIWPLEHAHTAASAAASARLGLAELLAAGVTCVNDMGTVRHTDAIGEVLETTGVRAVFGKALMDQGVGVPAGMLESSRAALDEVRALVRRFHGAGGGRLQVSLAPRFILSCSEESWEGVKAVSSELGLLVHTHLAEGPTEGREVEQAVGRSAARYFEHHGVLGPRFIGAHGVWLEADELQALQRANAALAHCPNANLKLGSGLAHVRAWIDHDLRRGLGCDGAACNNRLDPFLEMGSAGAISRVKDSARPLAAREVVALATCEGARALGLADRIGRLQVGLDADVIAVDVSGPHHGPEPEHDPYAALVYAARGADVALTMVAGRVLYRERAWTTLDPKAAVADARAERRGLLRRLGLAS